MRYLFDAVVAVLIICGLACLLCEPTRGGWYLLLFTKLGGLVLIWLASKVAEYIFKNGNNERD